ncbi:MAG TPA: hypothetical protein ENN99_15735, partial [Chloroflexi bacterium]|nr:hypothetical protein [Chloroflexota bacterium]
MRTKSLLVAAAILILATLACGPIRSPTPEADTMSTSVAQTVEAQLTSVAQAQPSPTSLPDATETLPPATDTPIPSPLP